jgi:hypothetical protein
MSETELFSALGIILILCVLDWRLGIALSLTIGFLQDVFRKLLPGEPVYCTVLVGAGILASYLGAYRRGIPLNFKAIHAWNKSLRLPITVFILLVLVQSGAALIKTGSPIIAGIGLLAYLAPLPAILLGYRFSRNERDIVRFARVYLVVSLAMLTGVYFSYWGYDWGILRSVGETQFIYSTEGQLVLHSGFLRSAENAAWHAATAVCLIVMLLLISRRGGQLQWAAGLMALFLLGALLLTGRRKFLVEILLFIALYATLLMWYRKGTTKLAYVLGAMTATAFAVYVYFTPASLENGMESYYQRSLNAQQEATGRVKLMTLESFQYVIAQNGVFGSGAGTGSQGAQYFGGGATIVGGAAEGGLGKVLAELGVPGLVMLFWLAIGLARYVYAILNYVKSGDPIRARLAYGLLAFIVANSMVYVIAHQIFGDVFVLLILGFCLGFLLSIPRMNNTPALTRRRHELLIQGPAMRAAGIRMAPAQEKPLLSGSNPDSRH